jgi:hypothetical protein
MREPLEMITVLRMQNMVEIRKKNTCFVTKSLFEKKNILSQSPWGYCFLVPPWGHLLRSWYACLTASLAARLPASWRQT